MTEWAKLKVVDLKAELKRRDLPQHGLKADLVARLIEADDASEEAAIKDAPVEANEPEPEAPSEAAPADPIDEPATEEHIVESNGTEEFLVKEPVIEAPVAEETIVEETVVEDSKEEPPMPQTVQTANPTEESREQEASEDAPKETSVAPEQPAIASIEPPPAEAAAEVPVPSDATEKQPEETIVPEMTTSQETPAPVAPVETMEDRQKRKRRSKSPPSSDDASARKRARGEEEEMNGDVAPVVKLEPEQEQTKVTEDPEAMDTSEPPPPQESPVAEPPVFKDEMEYERDVAPAVHAATNALYIKHFMRPLRPGDVEAHLVELASPPGAPLDNEVVTNFFLDQVRTHAFAVFKNTAAASRVRMTLHNTVWPNESNRKALWVDFVPPEKVQEWIQTEQTSGGPRSGARWEVLYKDRSDGTIEALLESGASSRPGPPPGPSGSGVNAIPSGPRSLREPGPPTRPRAVRPGTGPGPRPPPHLVQGSMERTNARPSIAYQPVSAELARRRLENIRHFYSPDKDRDFGREINRYSFENGDTFVDRGKEVFEGIRPPHRERERRRGGGGGRRRGFRPRSDRYLPGLSSGRDERRPRYDDGGERDRGDRRRH